MTDTAARDAAAAEMPVLDTEAPTVFNLRRAHVELLKAWPTLEDGARHEQAGGFRLKVRDAGAHLEDEGDRDAAQGMIDYWTATLAALPSHEGFPELIALARFKEGNRPNLKGTVVSPFVGLNSFAATDKERFFGRLDASHRLLERVLEQPVVIVAGPSGSGKSSLVFAGLEPKLEDLGRWQMLPAMTPGNDPIAALLQPFRPPGAPSDWLDLEREALLQDPKRLAELAAKVFALPVFLPIDQGEEVFTFEIDTATRQTFFEALAALAHGEREHRIVITVRSDYLPQIQDVAPLFAGGDAEKSLYVIEPLSSRELQDAITGPAQRIGLKIDPRVIEDLVREVVGEPAALPLLQFTLTRLWRKAKADRITWEDYETVGRPADALRQAAEEVWTALSLDENREAARLIFLQLVRQGRGAESVRGGKVRRETLRKLAAADRIDRTLDRFVVAGLLRRTPGSEADDDRFEVAHETLIRQWPRLVGWLKERSDDNEEVGRLLASAELWRNSGDRGYLLDGEALRKAGVAAVANPQLAEYVAASRRWRQVRQRRVLMAALLALLVLIGVGTAFLVQRRDASSATALAENEAARAEDEAGRAIDASLIGASAESRAQIAEQTLARLLAADPGLLPAIPAPLQPRVAAVPIPPSAKWLRAAKGHDPNFLGVAVPLPTTAAPVRVLNYTHYSVGYDTGLGMPRYVISDYDGAATPLPSLAIAGFATDPRLPANSQRRAFAGLAADEGRVPLVSWREIGWQGSGAQPTPRNDIVTGSVVQPWVFNQGRWNRLRRTLLSIGAPRIIFIAGPIFSPAPAGQPVPAPRAFWKVAIYRDDGPQATLHADAYVVPVAEPRTAPAIRTYQVELAALSRLTGLDFRLPRQAATPAVTSATPAAVVTVEAGTVYLQFAQMTRGDARGISSALETAGFHVPGEERVQVLGLHEVRYYYPQDAERAGRLARTATTIAAEQGFGGVTVNARLLRLKTGTRLPKPGVLELWLTMAASRK